MSSVLKSVTVIASLRRCVVVAACSSFYLESGEAVALVAGQLCVDEFGEKKLSELWTLKYKRSRRKHSSQISLSL